VWATYAVNDHLVDHPFVRDLMLFDRLVIPVPNTDDKGEWDRWVAQDWDPAKQERLLDLLGDRAVRVVWDTDHQKRWEKRYLAGTNVAQNLDKSAFEATRAELASEVPSTVRAVTALTAYPSLDALTADVGLRQADAVAIPYGAVAAILGRELLVPDGYKKDEDLLKAALELSGQPAFQKRRAAFWRWQRQFTHDDVVTDPAAVQDALDEMLDLIADERQALKTRRVRTAVSSVIMVCSVTVGLLAAPLVPVAATTAFLSIGQWAVDHLGDRDRNYSGASLFGDVRHHFGWR